MQRGCQSGELNVYNNLYEAWKKEKESSETQKLSKTFYTELARYMKRIREEGRMLDKKTTKARLLEREFENAKRLARELVDLRYDKALRNAASGKSMPREILTEEEEKLHGKILPLAESYKHFLKEILRGRVSHVEKEAKPKKLQLVRVLQEIPAIVGADMKTYGPFKPEDIATLPSENARILVKRAAAVEIETK
jgi:DNA replication factor GINS